MFTLNMLECTYPLNHNLFSIPLTGQEEVNRSEIVHPAEISLVTIGQETKLQALHETNCTLLKHFIGKCSGRTAHSKKAICLY